MKVYQIWLGDITIEIKKYMDKVKSLSTDYLLETTEKYPGLPYFVQSNLMRLEMAIQEPNLFYLDADVELLKIPKFTSKGAYMSTDPNFDGIYPSLFYVNGETDVFKRTLDHYREVYASRPLLNLGLFFEPNIIPPICYNHHYLTHKEEYRCTD